MGWYDGNELEGLGEVEEDPEENIVVDDCSSDDSDDGNVPLSTISNNSE